MTDAAALLPGLVRQPFHVQLMLAIVVGSGLFCFAVVALGWLRSCLCSPARRLEGLPPLPASFPYAGDQIYAALFCTFLLWMAALEMLSSSKEVLQQASFGWSALVLGVAAQVAIYLPMLIRYAVLHPWHRPTQPWRHYVVLPLLLWGGLYLTIMLMDTCGLNSWVVRATGCPEHQDLVLLFSRGDNMQRLYITICAVLVAPVAEECCFRGFLYPTLRRWGGVGIAAVASALLFGAIHASLAQMLPLTLFGIVQCLAYERERSLWLPIAVHMLFNTSSLIATALLQP